MKTERRLNQLPQTHRAAEAGEIARKLIDVDMPVLPAGPIEQAIMMARDGRSLVVATGSVFLAGAVRDLLGERPEG